MKFFSSFCAAVFLLLPHVSACASTRVVASIAPVHSLASMIFEGVGEVELVFPATVSPHGAVLSPSQARKVRGADILVWIGPVFEPSIARLLKGADAESVAVFPLPDLLKLPARDIGHLHHDDNSHEANDNQLDPHIWMSTINAKVILREIAERLISFDPENKSSYELNLDRALARVTTVDQEIRQTMSTVPKGLVFAHDAFQYFEQSYHFSPHSIVATGPEHTPGIRKISKLKQAAVNGEVECIFSEPQIRSSALDLIVEDTGIPIVSLDPLGSEFAPGSDLWLNLMTTTAKRIANCKDNNAH